MNPVRIVIVEDEQKIRKSLINVLKLHYPNGIIVGEAEDAITGIEAIKNNNPDVVLLDIKMPGDTGFDMLRQLMPFTFKVIFITAFNEFAVQAFKFSAIDYLLKPVVPQELIDALQRVEYQFNAENSNSKLDALISNMSGLTREAKKIVLNSHDKMQVVGLNEIVRCEADGNYTHFFLQNKRTIIVSRPLKEYDDMLSPLGFFRCHHSHLVNLAHVDRLEKRDGGILILKDGSEVSVSARKNSELIAALNRI
jgi:two-component system, LytTR family, response regulator